MPDSKAGRLLDATIMDALYAVPPPVLLATYYDPPNLGFTP
jgi:hypothetical protein